MSRYTQSDQEYLDDVMPSLKITPASEIPERPIQWLWKGWIPLGKVTVLVGDPGLGKSLITTTIAALVSSGGNWPVTGGTAPEGDVIVLSGEDDAGDTIRPRLRVANADLSKVHVLDPIVSNGSLFSIHDHITELEAQISKETKLVVIDPASAFTGDIDSHNNTEVRALLFKLKMFAERTGVAVVCVTHFSKKANNPVYRVMGSLAWTAAARSVICVVKDNENKERRLMLHLKSNIANDSGGYAYSVQANEEDIAEVHWEPQIVDVAVEDLLSNSNYGQKITEAEDFLVEMLTPGSKFQTDIEREAKVRGISPSTLRRAKKELNIVSDRVEGRWFWKLPEQAES